MVGEAGVEGAADHRADDCVLVEATCLVHGGDGLAVTDDGEGVGDLFDFVELVGDHDAGHALTAEVVQQHEQILRVLLVERRGRLVENEQLDVLGQCLGDLHELLLADAVGESTIVPEWAGEDVGSRISEALGLPVQVDNDANLGALAQLTWSQDSTENFIFVKVGTGIGTGIVIDGGLYTGTRGLAGEIGHTTVVENGAPCRCGNRGCVETVSSIAGMLRALEPSVNPPTTAAQLVASAREGDAVSLRVVEDAGLALGRVLGQAASLLDPGTIVIGGPLGDLGDLLLTPIRRGIVRNAPHEISQETRVVWSDLGDRAEALGAVSRALSAADEKMLETKPVGVS